MSPTCTSEHGWADPAGRFNWEGTHDYREIIAPENNNLARRLQADLARHIETQRTDYFLANPLRARESSDVTAMT